MLRLLETLTKCISVCHYASLSSLTTDILSCGHIFGMFNMLMVQSLSDDQAGSWYGKQRRPLKERERLGMHVVVKESVNM